MARSLASPVDRMSVRTPHALRPAAVGTVDTLPRLPPVDHRPASTLDHGQSAAPWARRCGRPGSATSRLPTSSPEPRLLQREVRGGGAVRRTAAVDCAAVVVILAWLAVNTAVRAQWPSAVGYRGLSQPPGPSRSQSGLGLRRVLGITTFCDPRVPAPANG